MTGQVKTHRPSALKQQNKKHHTLGHKSKRQLGAIQKGRVNDHIVIRKAKLKLTKLQKKNQHQQIKKHKTEETNKAKRNLGTNDTAPFLILIVPMSKNIRIHCIVDLLCMGDPEASVNVNMEGVTHVGCKRFKKRLSFIAPPIIDRTSILDAAKVSDSVLFVWDANEEDIMKEGKTLLTIMKAQGLPTVVHSICFLESLSQKKKLRMLKELKKEITIAFPEPSKVFSLGSKQETLLLLRQLSEQKKHDIYFRDKRSHMLAEEVEFDEGVNHTGTLIVSGYIRGQRLSANSVIHIPGWENYQIERIEGLEDPHLLGRSSLSDNRFTAGKTEFPTPTLQKSLEEMSEEIIYEDEDELEVDAMETEVKTLSAGTDTDDMWGNPETDDESDCDSDDSSSEFETVGSTSECLSGDQYESAAESLDDDPDNLWNDVSDKEDKLSDMEEENYDSNVDYDAEMKYLQEVEDNKNFPDEIDTPFDVPARVRFSKYRGLKSFRTSTWDVFQNLPVDYKRIVGFKNYHFMRKRILKTDQDGVEIGSYVRVHLKSVPKIVYDEYVDFNYPLVLFSLLEHEQRMSIVNLVLKSHNSGHLEAIKSKEKLIFHVGFRRFSNCPIFSEHTDGNKFMFLRYFHPSTTVVATMFAPVVFSPCPVSVFTENKDGTQDLVAIGSVYSVDSKRLICKRICLSGHPFKIKPNVTVARYMFFNREDIEFFKIIRLRTKMGARGKIVGPIGTHGHMKCQFKEKLASQDVIFLTLYKRAFPKLRYDALAPRLRKTIWNFDSSDDESNVQVPKAKKHKRVHFSSDA